MATAKKKATVKMKKAIFLFISVIILIFCMAQNITPLHHDKLDGFVANEHIDWTSDSNNLSTTGTVTAAKLLHDASTYIDKDGSNNMTFTDAVTGTKTLAELITSASGAPTNADYLVGTANATLTAEIVVGTTPGGELGGSWASPTIDDGISIDSPTFTTAITATDLIDSAHYNADSIDNEHINWGDIDNLGDEGAVSLATLATTLTITDNESTAENNALIFTSGGDLDGGNLGLECDGNAYYTPSTGTITAAILNATDEDNVLQIDGTTILRTGTAGNNNLFLGVTSFNTDEGTSNIGIGLNAGFNNDSTGGGSTGLNNIYIGYGAGYGATGGSNNTGYKNVAIGVDALRKNTTGRENVCIGFNALYNNTTGIGNFALGANALLDNVVGEYNVAIGANAGQLNLNNNNVYIGRDVGSQGTSAISNTAIGTQALKFNISGHSNVVIGVQAGLGTSGQSRSKNTIIGTLAGTALTSGGDNVFIGYRAGQRQTSNSNLLILDNQDRGSAAAELTNALIYGTFDASPTNQTLRINATISTANQADTLGSGVTTFVITSNVMTITGDGGGNTVATITGANSGALLTLIFMDANVTITDDDAHGADSVDLSGAFTSADDKSLQLVYDGTSWYETSRSVN